MADQIVVLSTHIERDVADFIRRFPSVRSDLAAARKLLAAGQPLLQQWRFPGFGQREIWKGRVLNTEINKGKSGGYRLIWEVRQDASISLLYLYDKQINEPAVMAEIKRRL